LALTAIASATAPRSRGRSLRSLLRRGFRVGGKPPLPADGALAPLGALAARETRAVSPRLAVVYRASDWLQRWA